MTDDASHPPDDADPASDDPAADNPYVDGQAAALREGTDSGPLFADSYRPGESGTQAGLIDGSRDDPTLVAGVGYPLLGDLAIGTVVAYRIAEMDLPGVAVADCSHTPIAVYQTISAGEYETVLFVGSAKRGGELNDGTPSETPGAIREYDPADAELPGDVVERIGESAMGSNTIENVLVICRARDALPDDSWVVEVEPGYDSWGMNVDEFTEPVEEALPDVFDRVLDYVAVQP